MSESVATRSPRPRIALLGGLALACAGTAGCGTAVEAQLPAPIKQIRMASLGPAPLARNPFRFFSSSGYWNRPLSSTARLDPRSRGVVAALLAEIAQVETGVGPLLGIETTSYSVPLYTVGADQPTVSVRLNKARPIPALSSAWRRVPLPATAHPAAGTDGELVVWQPSTERMWEFFQLVRRAGAWLATFGGAMQAVSSNPGAYGPEAWPGAVAGWGASGSSLPIVGGLITLEDLKEGVINHALAMSVPRVRARIYASPARRTDGTSSSPLALPEGAHLRLDPRLDLASLHLRPLARMIALAAQRYGIFVRDSSPDIGLYAQDPTPTGADPYSGPTGYFEGRTPAEILTEFPWSHLELLRMRLHREPVYR